jgi:hypothetical protein
LTGNGGTSNTNVVYVQNTGHRTSTVLDLNRLAVGLVGRGSARVVLGLALAAVVIAVNRGDPQVGASSVEDNTERLSGSSDGNVANVFNLRDSRLEKKIFFENKINVWTYVVVVLEGVYGVSTTKVLLDSTLLRAKDAGMLFSRRSLDLLQRHAEIGHSAERQAAQKQQGNKFSVHFVDKK